jgi:hypothetical protein
MRALHAVPWLALVIACGGPPRSDDSAAAPDARDELGALGAAYQHLRAEPGHWSQPPAPWNPATDAPAGRKRAVMTELGERLVPGTRARVLAVMGPPDAVARPGDPLWQLAASSEPPPSGPEILVYTWRGHHDFLFFEVDGARVTRSAWWMAYE